AGQPIGRRAQHEPDRRLGHASLRRSGAAGDGAGRRAPGGRRQDRARPRLRRRGPGLLDRDPEHGALRRSRGQVRGGSLVGMRVDPRTRKFVAARDRARATLSTELEEELAPIRALSLEARGDWVARTCRAAWAILRSRPDGATLVAEREEPAPDYALIWRRLS